MRFHGKVGYGETVETSPGVHEEVITERTYFGDVVRTGRRLYQGENINPELTLNGNAISIVADAHANEHFFGIRYVVWQGVRWIVSNVEIVPPRLTLYLGEVYNGPEATAPVSP